MKNLWVGAVMSLALACSTAYAQDMMPEEGPQAQETAQPAKHQANTHKKRMHKKKRAKRHHHPRQHHYKHQAKKHRGAVPEGYAGHESPVEQKINQETELNNR